MEPGVCIWLLTLQNAGES